MKGFTWKSPPCQVQSIDRRFIEKTGDPYGVIKVLPEAMNYPNRKEQRAFKGREVTLMCFKETLLPVFKVLDVLMLEGEVTFRWGNTFFSILKVWRENGERLLKAGDGNPGCPAGDACHRCPYEDECPLFEPKEGCKNRFDKAENREEDLFTKESIVNDNLIPW